MPTLPAPHEHREAAESFGDDAERYERTRPSYPDALIRAIVDAAPGRDLLDVGIGTGIAARQFRAAGCRVRGVEVDPRMAEVARRTGFDTDVSPFESWEPGDRRFDVLVAGQTWHWIDPVAGARKAASVLAPNGLIALFWNAFQPPPEVGAAFAAVFRRVLPDAPGNLWDRDPLDAYSMMLDTAENGLRAATGFAPAERWRFDWERRYTRDEWLDQVPTFGGFSRLPEQLRRELLGEFGAAVDALGGTFSMPYASVVLTARRTAVE